MKIRINRNTTILDENDMAPEWHNELTNLWDELSPADRAKYLLRAAEFLNINDLPSTPEIIESVALRMCAQERD